MFTQVSEEFFEGRRNHRLLFGKPVRCVDIKCSEGYTARANYFAPGARFALDLWSRNAYGTVRWNCFVCECIRPGESGECVPRVTPAASILLSTRGAAQSRVFLAWLAGLAGQGIDALACSEDTFLAAHFRLQGSRADAIGPQRLSGRL